MSFLGSLSRLVKDPPPDHVFELSEAGLAYSVGGHMEFEKFPEGTLVPSPMEDNIRQPEKISALLARVAPPNLRRRTPAALILPDYAARVSVLDFDSFPSSPEEQLSLVKFRVKKTIPFDIESAAVSYAVQPGSGGKAKIEVVAVTVSLEILARYEALFRNAGFHPGEVTTSGIATLRLLGDGDSVLLAKLAGKVLSVMILVGGKLRLFRCLALEDTTEEEIRSVLLPTLAYSEDELASPVKKILLCGFARVPDGLPVETGVLRLRAGVASPYAAGLAGYVEGAA
jgi:type IV pilus assembly protein PilM